MTDRQIQKYNRWPHFLRGAVVAGLLSLVCDELCLLHLSLPLPSVTALHSSIPPSLPNFPLSAQLFICSCYNSGSRSAVSLTVPPTQTHPPFCKPTYQRAGRPVSGPVPDGLGQQCVLGLRLLKRGPFHPRGLLFGAAAVCFGQDSCSKPSRPPQARLKEGT